MIPQLVAKQAVKTLVGQAEEASIQKQKDEIMEMKKQEEYKKKYFWSKSKPTNPILTPDERKLLSKVKSRARFLDKGFSCCCFTIGFDGLIGLIPVFGDFAGLLLALQLVHMCMEADLPNEIVSRMMFNIGFDFVIGLVPLLGDMMDFVFKCNTKNALLFEHYLYRRRDIVLEANYSQLENGHEPLLQAAEVAPLPPVIRNH